MIKFRGWTPDGKEVKGYYCKEQDKHYIIPFDAEMLDCCPNGLGIGNYIEVDPETVGQYIDFIDKNNKEIWQNDIMQSKDGLRKYVVTYNKRESKGFLKGLGKAWAVNSPSWWEYEIIGTTFENPELLEGTKCGGE